MHIITYRRLWISGVNINSRLDDRFAIFSSVAIMAAVVVLATDAVVAVADEEADDDDDDDVDDGMRWIRSNGIWPLSLFISFIEAV